jgi:hypothetical protein
MGEADVILNIKLIKGENGGVTLSHTERIKMSTRGGVNSRT